MMIGQDVVLRPLPAAVPALELTSLPDHPHLTSPAVVTADGGRSYIVTAHATHGGLDGLVSRRGALTAGETVMVVMSVGRVLAALHAAGRVHGSVTLASVLLDASMRPLLDGSVCRPAPTAAADAGLLACEDVRALGVVAVDALGGDVPPALRAVLSAATDPMPSLRPSAVELVRSAMSAVPPEGVRLTGFQDIVPGADERPSSVEQLARRLTGARRSRRGSVPRRRHAGESRTRVMPTGGPSIRPLPALVCLALVAGAVLAGAVWARASAPGSVAAASVASASPAASPATPPVRDPDWWSVVTALDTARSAAFANADRTVLATVDAPGSVAMKADLAAVGELADADVQAQGYRVVQTDVHVLSSSADSVVLAVSDRRSAYRLVRADGSVASSVPARDVRTWRVHLVNVSGTWLVHDVARLTS